MARAGFAIVTRGRFFLAAARARAKRLEMFDVASALRDARDPGQQIGDGPGRLGLLLDGVG